MSLIVWSPSACRQKNKEQQKRLEPLTQRARQTIHIWRARIAYFRCRQADQNFRDKLQKDTDVQTLQQFQVHSNNLPNGQRQRAHLRRRKSQPLVAQIFATKTGKDFTVIIALHSGSVRVAADFFYAENCKNAERAWLEGYYRACELADGRRVIIAQNSQQRRAA
jgi:hypothetical protein